MELKSLLGTPLSWAKVRSSIPARVSSFEEPGIRLFAWEKLRAVITMEEPSVGRERGLLVTRNVSYSVVQTVLMTLLSS